MSNIIKVICAPRNENKDEATSITIAEMSDKTLQSAEEKDKKIIEITEYKKESAFEQTNESNRILKTIKNKMQQTQCKMKCMTKKQWFSVKIVTSEELNPRMQSSIRSKILITRSYKG